MSTSTPAGESFNDKKLPISIGIEVYGGFMRKIIKKGTIIPAVTSVCLKTKFNRQPSAVIRVVAGERPRVEDNIIVAEKTFCHIPDFGSGTRKLGALVRVDIVEGKVQVTCNFGLARESQDTWDSCHQDCKKMSREDLNKISEEMKEFAKEDQKEWDRLEKLWEFGEWCVDLEDMFSRRLAKRLEEDADIPELLGHVRQTLDWLARATEASTQVLTERRYELEDLVVPKLEYLLDNKIMDDFGNEILSESDHNPVEDEMQTLPQDPISLPQDLIRNQDDDNFHQLNHQSISSESDHNLVEDEMQTLPQDPISLPQDPIRNQDDDNFHQPDKEISFGIFEGQPYLDVKLVTYNWDYESSANQVGPPNQQDPVVDGEIKFSFMNEDTVSIGSRSTIDDSDVMTNCIYGDNTGDPSF